MANILVLHGPNLNLLGAREPHIYGHTTLAQINNKLLQQAELAGHTLVALQSNSESQLIQHVHNSANRDVDIIIFNPAAFTHTSIALRDALLAIAKPFIEVHLSNIQQREPFRQISYFSDIAVGTISGLGPDSYYLALQYANSHFHSLSLVKGA